MRDNTFLTDDTFIFTKSGPVRIQHSVHCRLSALAHITGPALPPHLCPEMVSRRLLVLRLCLRRLCDQHRNRRRLAHRSNSSILGYRHHSFEESGRKQALSCQCLFQHHHRLHPPRLASHSCMAPAHGVLAETRS